jgi:hypothetical protein
MRKTLWTCIAIMAVAGCTGGDATPGIPKDIKSIIFLQRASRNEMGNVFDYTGYVPGARLVKLEPPSANGKLTVLTSDAMFNGADIMSYDINFAADTLVFSARLQTDQRYQIFTMAMDGTNVKQLTEGDNDYVYPVFIPGQKIFFTSNNVVEANTPQFEDEYERATTAQVGIVNLDGTGLQLGPRNVSHRVSPAVLPTTGKMIYSEWLHLGGENSGHLRMMNTDMTGMVEAFGGEGDGPTNSYLKARPVDSYTLPDGRTTHRVVAVATSRDRTLQAGKLLLIDLGASEALATYKDMTPLVPGDREPSALGVGRYYDAEPIDAANLQFLVSWADGPVQNEILSMAKTNADFGIYLFDGRTGTRYPIWNDPNMWDVQARPVKARQEPPPTESPISGQTFTVSALNVYNSSIFQVAPGSAIKVRLLEGFSGEECTHSMFGSTEFDGQSLYGEVPVYSDGSFSANVPANVPVHMQLLDKFAMSIGSEPVWISGRPGESRTCGGCHEDRAKNALIQPGNTEATLRGPVNLDVPRPQRISTDFTYGNFRGVPWNMAVQPIFDQHCIGCHNGQVGPANPSCTVTDMTTMEVQTFVFDLRGQALPVRVGARMSGDYSASYISLAGIGEMAGDDVLTYQGECKQYMNPGSAKDSLYIQKLNPPQQFPADPNTRAFAGTPIHPVDVGAAALSDGEYYTLILNTDAGGQYYFRENCRQ